MIHAGRHTHVPDDVDCHVTLKLGSFCSIASGLTIISGQHPAVDAPEAVSNFPFAEHGWGEYPPSRHDGEVDVGSDVWIGQNVSIMEGVHVGHGATLAAEAVVVRNVLPYQVVAGNPAIGVKSRFYYKTVDELLRIAWWEWNGWKIAKLLPLLSDADSLIRASRDWCGGTGLLVRSQGNENCPGCVDCELAGP